MLAVSAEVQAGMWVRNGANMSTQALAYKQSFFCTFFIDADIFMLQVYQYFVFILTLKCEINNLYSCVRNLCLRIVSYLQYLSAVGLLIVCPLLKISRYYCAIFATVILMRIRKLWCWNLRWSFWSPSSPPQHIWVSIIHVYFFGTYCVVWIFIYTYRVIFIKLINFTYL